MSNYVACELGATHCRVMLGTLLNGHLTMSEVRRFQNKPIEEKESLQWNIPHLYRETIDGLRGIAAFEEPIEGISCNSWGADYLLFDSAGSLITPTYHHSDPRTRTIMDRVFSKVPWETIYEETGVQQVPGNTLFQLAAEKSRRLSSARHLIPVADAFNYLLTGVPCVEMSLASTTQLYNPLTQSWSDRLLNALRLPPALFPRVVEAGTKLGRLRPEVAQETGLDDAQVVASCSHEVAAALIGLPIDVAETWAYLRIGASALMGAELAQPMINDITRTLNFTNEIGYGGSVPFSKPAPGLWILEECRRFWDDKDRQLDGDLLVHLAGSASPFASLINPSDPRFLTPGDMPLKIQAFCRETNQVFPRKPGAIFRCILESLALQYRKTLEEIEVLTGAEVKRLFILSGSANPLLNHFTASAIQIPVVIAPEGAASIGNVVVQAMALGHIKSLTEARQIVRDSFKMEMINPRPAFWDEAYDRFLALC